MAAEGIQNTSSLNELYGVGFRGFINRAGEILTTVAIPVLMALGAALCAVLYSDTIKAMLANYPRLNALSGHALKVAGGVVILAALLILKKLWDLKAERDAVQKLFEKQKEQSTASEPVKVKEVDAAAIAKLEQGIKEKEKEIAELQSKLDQSKSDAKPLQDGKIAELQKEKLAMQKARDAAKLEVEDWKVKYQNREAELAEQKKKLELEKQKAEEKFLFQDVELTSLKKDTQKLGPLELALKQVMEKVSLYETEKKESAKKYPFECDGKHYQFQTGSLPGAAVKTSIKLATTETGELVAIAVVKIEKNSPHFVQEAIIKAWQKAASKNKEGGLCPILATKTENGYQYFVMPYCEQGNLMANYFNGSLTLEDRLTIFEDIIRGFHALHEEQKIIHGDPKDENIFLAKVPTKDGEKTHAFVGDIDSVQFGDKADKELEKDIGYQAKKSCLGNRSAWPPERFCDGKVDPFKAEVWGVGLIAAMLFIQNPAINLQVQEAIEACGDDLTDAELKEQFRANQNCNDLQETCAVFEDWLDWDNAAMIHSDLIPLKDVLRKMLEPNPKKRLTMDKLKPMVKEALKAIRKTL